MFWFCCCWWWKLNSLSSWSLLGRFFYGFCVENLQLNCVSQISGFRVQSIHCDHFRFNKCDTYVLVVQRIHTISKFTTSNLLLIFIVTHITTVPYPFLNCPLFNETNSKIRTFHNNFDTENEKKITTSNCYENNQRFGLKNRLKEFLVIVLQCVRVCFFPVCAQIKSLTDSSILIRARDFMK